MREADQEPEGKVSKKGSGIGHVPFIAYFAKAKSPGKQAGYLCWSWAVGGSSYCWG